ncbi:hypothetical protein RS84_03085 [Microbacterium hydrocarbonoxydans]|uniref:HNH endonuclease n=1 Tax=Microbacterium hydrocarbonoxydans TaxID=273678 RepID=A0A0M2HPP7_9MICO|nr:hypothetical protein [Microbacterium hydrocarbonoxydans]KJL46451.1 hypothetical protein RS84_03085 [Microbacterium hydrocarbonoxydans]
MPSTGQHLKEMQALHRHRNFVQMLAYLRDHPCADCGEPDPVVLDFDHRPGVRKRFEIARAVNASTRAWSTILREIAKCDVVCANCHRRRTARRAGHRKHLVNLGMALEEPAVARRGRRTVPHGGGAKGKHGCPCEPCRLRRSSYARDYRLARKLRERAADDATGAEESIV